MQTKHLCALIHIRNQQLLLNMFLSVKDFFLLINPLDWVLLLGIIFVIYYTALSDPCSLVITFWESADVLALLCDVYLCLCHFPI